MYKTHLFIILLSLSIFIIILLYKLFIRNKHTASNNNVQQNYDILPPPTLIKSTQSNEDLIDFGQEQNAILNNILDRISNKLCGKLVSNDKKFPMTLSHFKKSYYHIVINLAKLSKEQELFLPLDQIKGYLATLSLVNNPSFNIKNGMVTVNGNKNVKLVNYFAPGTVSDINSNKVVIDYDTFTEINYNILSSFLNSENYITFLKSLNGSSYGVINFLTNNDNNPSGLLLDLLIQLILTRNKLTVQELERINIFLLGKTTVDKNMFATQNNQIDLSKFYSPLAGGYSNKQKFMILFYVVLFSKLNQLSYNNDYLKELIKNIFSLPSINDEKVTENYNIIQTMVNEIYTDFMNTNLCNDII
jgi:hypothetical protein